MRRDVERTLLRSRNGLKLLSGVGRPNVGRTPHDVVWSAGKVQLWRYRSDRRRVRPPLLLVHSLVSRSYILDLVPGNSAVELLLGRGFDVFLVDWGAPDAMEAGNTLETYCDDLLPQLVDATRVAAGSEDVALFGYCFGGVLSLLYLAGHQDAPVSSVAVLATPVDFTSMGSFSSLFQAGAVDPADLLDHTGNVPAEAVANAFRLLQPTGDLVQYANLWQHLWNDEFVAAHQVMAQWARDHIPFPGACMVQCARLLMRENRLASGRVPLGGRTVALADIRVPLLSVLGEKDFIVPPTSAAGLPDLVGSSDAEELRLPGGHANLLVGRAAQRSHLPAIADWLLRRTEVDR